MGSIDPKVSYGTNGYIWSSCTNANESTESIDPRDKGFSGNSGFIGTMGVAWATLANYSLFLESAKKTVHQSWPELANFIQLP